MKTINTILIMFTLYLSMVVLTGCDSGFNEESITDIDTVLVGEGAISDSINLVATTPTRYYVNTSDSTATGYYISEKDLADSNGIAIERVIATGAFTYINAYLDSVSGEYNNDVVIHNPNETIGFYYDELELEWRIVQISDIIAAQTKTDF